MASLISGHAQPGAALHAVILHSGFSTEAANVIAHVSQTVSVACYGRVDACGVCGGNNGTCGGCDGVALSGKTVDACGVCGGDGSSCCIPKPAQAQWHFVRIGHHYNNSNENGNSRSSAWSSMVTRARVGDLVVWENLLDRKVEIVGGAYDYKGTPAVDLSRLTTQQGHAIEALPDDDAIDVFIQNYLSMMRMKDVVERPTPSGTIELPATDSTSAYLRRRSTAGDGGAQSQQNQDFADPFPGWRTTRPWGGASFEVRRRSQQPRDLDTYEEEFVMGGVCCAQEEEEEATDNDNRTTGEAYGGKEVGRPRHDAAMERLPRVSVVTKLVEQKRRLGSPSSPANFTGVHFPAAVRSASDAAVRCLCRRSSSDCSDLTCIYRPSPDAGSLNCRQCWHRAASMPHRFFSPGLYLWHDHNNPAVHGVVLVAPSELVMDECGVCGGDGSSCPTRRSLAAAAECVGGDRDCAGMCGGQALVDECGECVLGTTGREFNAAKDCAGQCFGSRLPTDPACACEREKLDKCFVCGGDNFTCAGCDGVPNSGLVHDLCGVCGGDNSTCCFLPFAQATVVIRDFNPVLLPIGTLDAGEILLVTNLHDNNGYTFRLARRAADSAASSQASPQQKFEIVAQYSRLMPGNSLRVVVSEPGEYVLQSAESSAVAVHFSVRFNHKIRDRCDRCVYADADDADDNRAAYDHCCKIMEVKDDVHRWFETTHFHAAADPAVVTRMAPRTGAYRTAPSRHLLRLLEPQMVEWSAANQRLAVGDVVVLENRDLLDHVISIAGPQPMPDVVLDRGMVALAGPVLTPGTYRVVSRSSFINTTFTVEFAFACTVHTHDKEQPQLETTMTEASLWLSWLLSLLFP